MKKIAILIMLLVMLSGCEYPDSRQATVCKDAFDDIGMAYEVIGEWSHEFHEAGYDNCSFYMGSPSLCDGGYALRIVCYESLTVQ